jgi:DnaJ-class molecular chaperone
MSDKIVTKPYSRAYDIGWERIFGKKDEIKGYPPTEEICPKCDGIGGFHGGPLVESDNYHTCSKCNGTGKILKVE